jgi:dihydrodipicolinate synthase/N-acetylneuraminate lyase
MNRRGTPSAFVISITPFDAQGEVDFGALRAHFARLAESGVGVYVGGGGSGEGLGSPRSDARIGPPTRARVITSSRHVKPIASTCGRSQPRSMVAIAFCRRVPAKS